MVDTLGQGIDEHAGGRRLKVVALATALIDDLVPKSASRVLMPDYTRAELLHHGDNLWPRRMVGGEKVQHVHHGHPVPADGAPPEIRGGAGTFVGPLLLLALVPSVIEEPARRVIGVRANNADLLRNIIEYGCWLAEKARILGIERRAHIKTIKPHLAWIPLLVPEPALACARLSGELFTQQSGRLLVAIFFRNLVKRQNGLARVNVVEVVILCGITLYLPVRRNERADGGFSEPDVAGVPHNLVEL